MLSGLKPRSAVCSRMKLRISRPAPESKTRERATSMMTSVFRSLPFRKPPLTPLPESLSGSTIL